MALGEWREWCFSLGVAASSCGAVKGGMWNAIMMRYVYDAMQGEAKCGT